MIQSAKDEVNVAKDSGLWLDFSADDVAYWTAFGPSDCQHHNVHLTSLTGISVVAKRHNTVHRNFLLEQNPMVRNARESGYCIHRQQDHCLVCKLFAPERSHIVLQGKGSVTGEILVIDHHEKSTTHRDSMLTYLTPRQGVGLRQLERQIQD